MMHKGLGLLQLSPTEFWRSTPREIAGAFGSPPKPINADELRQNLNAMIERFPDL
jgi:uncharacterized phage protein (TIGR02216 family)